MPDKPQTELERDWKERWHNAKLGLESARAHVHSLKEELSSGPDNFEAGNAYKSALEQETIALIEYSRVLRIYTDLVVHGKIPDDIERKTASAGDD